MRRSLRLLAALWVLCLTARLMPAPSLFPAETPGGSELACTCSHGPESNCPMHHHGPLGSKPCSMRGQDVAGVAVLASFFGAIALLPLQPSAAVPVLAGTLPHGADAWATTRSAPPDPPPPRA